MFASPFFEFSEISLAIGILPFEWNNYIRLDIRNIGNPFIHNLKSIVKLFEIIHSSFNFSTMNSLKMLTTSDSITNLTVMPCISKLFDFLTGLMN